MITNFFSEINWLGVLLGTIAYFVLGALWYSKILFAPSWIKYHKIDVSAPDAKKGMGVLMALSFIMFFIVCVGLSFLINRLSLHQPAVAWKVGIFTGFFFSMCAISITYLYTKKHLGLHLIDGLYHVVGQALAAIVISCFAS